MHINHFTPFKETSGMCQDLLLLMQLLGVHAKLYHNKSSLKDCSRFSSLPRVENTCISTSFH
jgi:hypothetical protein